MNMKELNINYIKANYHCHQHCSFTKKRLTIMKKSVDDTNNDFTITRIPLNQMGIHSFKVIYSVPVGTRLRIRLMKEKDTVYSQEFSEGEQQVAQFELESGPTVLRMGFGLITRDRISYSIHKIKYAVTPNLLPHPPPHTLPHTLHPHHPQSNELNPTVVGNPVTIEQIGNLDLNSLDSRLTQLVQALHVSENSFGMLVENSWVLSQIMIYLTSEESLGNLILQQLIEYTLKTHQPECVISLGEAESWGNEGKVSFVGGKESLVPLKTIQDHLTELHNSMEIIQKNRDAINVEDLAMIQTNLSQLMVKKREYENDLVLLEELQSRFREEYLKITQLIQGMKQRQGTLDQIMSDLNLRMIVQTQEQTQLNALLRQELGIREEIVHHQALMQEQVPIYVKERFKFLLSKYVH